MAKKQQLGYKEIEERLRIIKDNHVPAEEIGYHILYSFGKGERDIARYKEGKGILKTFEGLLLKVYSALKVPLRCIYLKNLKV